MRGLVYARAEKPDDAGYALETELAEPTPELIEAAAGAASALDALYRPLVVLGRRLEAVLADAPDWMDAPARARVEGAIASLQLARGGGVGVAGACSRASAGRRCRSSSTG